MEVKNFAGKKKPKKIEKRAKKPRVQHLQAVSPPRRFVREVGPSDRPSRAEAESERLSHHIGQRVSQTVIIGMDLGNLSQISPSDYEEPMNMHSHNPEPSENLMIPFQRMQEGQSYERPVSHHHENRYMINEMNDDEGTEGVFQPEYRRVSRLDSPKMSISSSIKGRSVFAFQFQEDIPQLEPSDMLAKMQFLCNPVPKPTRFKLVSAVPQDQGSVHLALLTDDHDKSMYSQFIDDRNKKSSSRRSRRASRKNSSVENFNA